MIQFLRVLLFFWIIFSFYVIPGFSQTVVIDEIVGVIGSKIIKQSDIENEYNQMIKNGYPTSPDMKCDIFAQAVKSKMLVNQAMLDSIEISEPQIESELSQRLNYFISQIGSPEKLEKYFNKSMQEIKEDLRKSLREMQLVQKMQGTILGNIEITPMEVNAFYSNLSKDSIPFINSQIEIAQIAAYPPYSEQSVLEVKDKMLDFRKRIAAGEKFEVLARLYSEDPGTAAKGGEYGFSTKGELDPEFAKGAFALNTPGEISRIIESQFGYHLIQLIERRGDRVNFRHILMKPKIAPDIAVKVRTTLDSIAGLIRNDSISFDDAVKFYSMDVDTRFNNGLVSNPNTGGTKFEMDQLAPSDYYIVKKMKVGDISEPYESRDKNGKNIYKIVTVKSIIPSHRANLEDDYNLLQQMAINHKKMSILDEWFIEKRKSTFIQISDTYKNCGFTNEKWFKIK